MAPPTCESIDVTEEASRALLKRLRPLILDDGSALDSRSG